MTRPEPGTDDAVQVWRQKLAHLEIELAIEAGAAEKFEIRKQIEECKREILRLEAEKEVQEQPDFHPPSPLGLHAKSRRWPSIAALSEKLRTLIQRPKPPSATLQQSDFWHLRDGFSQFLMTRPNEAALKHWVSNHPAIFGTNCAVIGNAPLGEDQILDFMLVSNITVGLTWRMVKICRSDSPLFRQDGQPSESVSSAVSLIKRYQAWIRINMARAREFYPEIFQPPGEILIGRRDSLTEDQREVLRQMNLNQSVIIRTYDSLLESTELISFIDLDFHNAKTKAFEDVLPKLRGRFCFDKV